MPPHPTSAWPTSRSASAPAAASRSYLDQAAILFAAEVSGAEAIHPGYGFMSENAAFARRVEQAGLTFIGPTSASIAMMGDKIAARRAMHEAGIACVPGSDGPLADDPAAALALAGRLGYPVLVKAAAGGGGRGMRVVAGPDELAPALALTRKEARQAFGNDTIYLEKLLGQPRHVEIQVLADHQGQAVWLGSRDCSLQRRHQKVLEEAPAPCIDDDIVAAMGERCVAACRRIGYRGLGTFEFLVEGEKFHFIEMNTRLQVEHCVTEMITGIDLVQQQIRVARGEPLGLAQGEVRCVGHAFESRINAEHPTTFAPSPGRITRWEMPGGPGVRVDSHVAQGTTVSRHYDSLIAKLVVHGGTRAEALARLRVALDEMRVGGIATNLELHRAIVRDPDFSSGGVDILHLEHGLVERGGR